MNKVVMTRYTGRTLVSGSVRQFLADLGYAYLMFVVYVAFLLAFVLLVKWGFQ